MAADFPHLADEAGADVHADEGVPPGVPKATVAGEVRPGGPVAADVAGATQWDGDCTLHDSLFLVSEWGLGAALVAAFAAPFPMVSVPADMQTTSSTGVLASVGHTLPPW